MAEGRDYMSESEAEDVAGEEVTLPQDLPGAGNIKQQQSAVKLIEVLLYMHCISQKGVFIKATNNMPF